MLDTAVEVGDLRVGNYLLSQLWKERVSLLQRTRESVKERGGRGKSGGLGSQK